MIDQIRARRVALVTQMDVARLQHADLEETIKQQQQTLAMLQRNLDAMHGGLQELDALLTTFDQGDTDTPPTDNALAPGHADRE